MSNSVLLEKRFITNNLSIDIKNLDSDLPPDVSQDFIEYNDFKNNSFGKLLHILKASN